MNPPSLRCKWQQRKSVFNKECRCSIKYTTNDLFRQYDFLRYISHHQMQYVDTHALILSRSIKIILKQINIQ